MWFRLTMSSQSSSLQSNKWVLGSPVRGNLGTNCDLNRHCHRWKISLLVQHPESRIVQLKIPNPIKQQSWYFYVYWPAMSPQAVTNNCDNHLNRKSKCHSELPAIIISLFSRYLSTSGKQQLNNYGNDTTYLILLLNGFVLNQFLS